MLHENFTEELETDFNYFSCLIHMTDRACMCVCVWVCVCLGKWGRLYTNPGDLSWIIFITETEFSTIPCQPDQFCLAGPPWNNMQGRIVAFFVLVPQDKNRTTEAQLFHSSNHHKWIPYQILGSKTVKNVQIGQQTTEIYPKRPLSEAV